MTLRLRIGTGFAVLLLAGSPIATAQNRYSPEAAHGPFQRRFLEVTFTRVGGIPGTIESETLLPGLVRLKKDVIYLYDYGDSRVKAFDLAGRKAWTYGRAGQGPGEFSNPTDLKVDAEGRVWIADPTNLRITIYDPRTGDARFIRTPEPVSDVAPAGDGLAWAVPMNPQRLLLLLDETGMVQRYVSGPEFAEHSHPLLWELNLDPRARTGPIVSFRYSDRFFAVDGETGEVVEHRGIEKVEFPDVVGWESGGYTITRVAPDATEAAQSTAEDNGLYYVLFEMRSERVSIVDVYDSFTAQYIGSLRLPLPVSFIAVDDYRIAVVTRAEIPAIEVWSWGGGPPR